METKVRTTVSHSEVEAYLKCERQHYYGYGLQIQPIQQSDALSRGTLGHKVLEIFFKQLKNGVPHDEAKRTAWEFLTALISREPFLVQEVVTALTRFFDEYPFDGCTILEVEYSNVLFVTEDIQVPYVVDLIIRDRFGYVVAIDHKFVYDFISERDAQLMPQLAKYAVGLKSVGYPVEKFAYSNLRYRKLKEGSDAPKYLYQEFDITPERQMQTIREQALAAQRIIAIKQQPLPEWSYTALRAVNKMVCNMCSFRSLCVAELNDYQPQLVLNSSYEKRTRKEWTAEEEHDDDSDK